MMFFRPVLCVVVMLWVASSFALAASEDIIVKQQIGDDTTPPTTPSVISATPIAATQIDISWSTSTDIGFGLAGYKLFRDASQIATTSNLFFSDTGLTPSTTYSYSVAAFDVMGNVSTTSAPVSTTTLPAPIVPPEPAEATSTRSTQGVVFPTAVSLDILTGVRSAEITFQSRTPIQYIFRYGPTISLDTGFVQTDIFRKEHQTYVTDLDPNTTYYYELLGSDRFGRQRELSAGTFTTKAAYTIDAPPNVANFFARPVGSDVSLRWQNPSNPSFSYVRVVRSHYYYPTDPWGGFVVYEGDAESFYDNQAFREHTTQYYTIFTFNLDGVYSSGAIASATEWSFEGDVPRDSASGESVDLDVEETDTTVPAVEPSDNYRLQFSDIRIIQNGEIIAADNEYAALATEAIFEIQVPAALVPAQARTVTLTITNPFNVSEVARYILRRNEAKTYYTAVLNPLRRAGEYPLSVRVYDHQITLLGQTDGWLLAEDSVVEQEENSYIMSLVYSSGLLFLFVLSLWLLIVLLRMVARRRG